MKRMLWTGAAAIALFAGSPAMAADLPVYAPPVAPAPIPMAVAPVWTGFYVGAQLGYAFGGSGDDDCFSAGFGDASSIPGDSVDCGFFDGADDDHDGSLFAGAHVGYDMQIGSFVLGGVVDGNWLLGHDDDDDEEFDADEAFDLDAYDGDLTEQYAAIAPGEFGGVDWYGTARLRAGFAAGRFLVYGTGGLAFGETARAGGATALVTTPEEETNLFGGLDTSEFDDSCDETDDGFVCELDDGDDDGVEFGWALGAGTEVLVTDNFSVGLEYLYVNLGSDDSEEIEFTDGTTVDLDNGRDNDFHTISLKGAYRF